jgi:hypothetical protein
MARPGLPAPAGCRRSGHGRSRFLLDADKIGRIEEVVATHWPEQIALTDLGTRRWPRR